MNAPTKPRITRTRILAGSGAAVLALAATVATETDAAATPPRCYGAYATVWGGPGDGTVNAGSGRDIICGDGHEAVASGADADFLRARAGNCRLYAHDGVFDVVHGHDGWDRCMAYRVDDRSG
ncbi:hypothetical protein [Streptomyces sp. GESEQ-35]|uniref:hypothetical protein n=1 Tax=Streptomyces sp. GESEQ-35 TaxID=2812657 RepID=UPI001B32AA27|nr:hypothetical protein [Streptomyces sp. GESEQ-35]